MNEGGGFCVMVAIANQRGLHARAAAKFVKLAETFAADVSVTKDGMTVSARSIMGLMMLAAAQGTRISLCGTGQNAQQAVDALAELVKRKFDEE